MPLAVIASDLSRFHRVDDPGQLPSSRYYELVCLLPFYDGAVARILAQQLAPVQAQQPLQEALGGLGAPVGPATYAGSTLAAMTDLGPGTGIEWTG